VGVQDRLKRFESSVVFGAGLSAGKSGAQDGAVLPVGVPVFLASRLRFAVPGQPPVGVESEVGEEASIEMVASRLLSRVIVPARTSRRTATVVALSTAKTDSGAARAEG
jgi:hypothetical protein